VALVSAEVVDIMPSGSVFVPLRGRPHFLNHAIAWSADNQAWQANSTFSDLARGIAISVVFIAPDRSKADIVVSAGANARLPAISVRKSLTHKFDLTGGLRAIRPQPPYRPDSVRDRLLDNPPQLAP